MPSKHKPAVIDAKPDTSPAFTGFGPAAFQFFKDLTTHQDRDWFAINKHIYDEQVLAPMTALINDLSDALSLRGIPLQSGAKSAIFRIYRDLRFSKDKSPYKTHIAAALTRDGQKKARECCTCTLSLWAALPPPASTSQSQKYGLKSAA